MRPWRCDCLIASHLDLSDPPLRVVHARLHGSQALLSAVSISQLLTGAHVQRLRLQVHFNLPSCRCQRVFLRCTSCELEVSLSNCLVTLGGFTRLEWHLWSAPECVPAEIMVDQQFVQLATARVPFHTCKHALHIVVQARFCNPRPPRHSHISPMPEFLGACSSPSIVSRFQLFECSPHQQGPISQRTDLARRLTTPKLPPGSQRPRIPELSGARRQLATGWLFVHHGLDITNFKRVCRIHTDDTRVVDQVCYDPRCECSSKEMTSSLC